MHDVVYVFVLFCIEIEHEFKVVYLYTCNDDFVDAPQAPWWTQLQVQRWKQRKEKELDHVP